MKIKSIEFTNHPVLKNLNFNFEVDSTIKNFVLLVGENGGGKTILLDEIYKIISGGIILWNDGVDRKLTVEFSNTEMATIKVPTKQIVFDYKESYNNTNSWNRIKVFDSSGVDITQQLLPVVQGKELKKIFKCAYSTVEINFVPENIESVKASSIDSEEIPKSKSSADISKEISQLLVDIKAQDDAKYAMWMKKSVGKSMEVPKIIGKLDRFKSAYSKMFENKEMIDVRAESGSQKIVFRDTRNKIEFEASALSSGEKQIVYRVGYLLRNLRTLSGGIILIDEPELSLHPIWQIKFINFLRELFTNGEKLDVQFIIATHSPYLLKSSLDVDVGVTILARNPSGIIESQRPRTDKWSIFKGGPSIAEINYYAYGLVTLDFHNELYGVLHEKYITQGTEPIDVNNRESIRSFDFYILATKDNSKLTSQWSELKNGEQQAPYDVTKTTFIRNSIHHPESKQSEVYTDKEMKNSIEYMISLL